MLKRFFGGKNGGKHTQDSTAQGGSGDALANALGALGPGAMPDESKMTRLQRLAWKQFQKMSPEKQRKIMQKALTPKNIAKHRKEIIAQLDALKAAGMMSDDQYRLAKRKLGL